MCNGNTLMSKRSLLPLGDVLGFLFGTGDQHGIDVIIKCTGFIRESNETK